MTDLHETLAAMRRSLQRHEGLLEEECAELLSAVEKVLELCDAVPERDDGMGEWSRGYINAFHRVRAALQDAIGGE